MNILFREKRVRYYLRHDDGRVELVISWEYHDDPVNRLRKHEIVTSDRAYEIHTPMNFVYTGNVCEGDLIRCYIRGRSPLELWRVFDINFIDNEPVWEDEW